MQDKRENKIKIIDDIIKKLKNIFVIIPTLKKCQQNISIILKCLQINTSVKHIYCSDICVRNALTEQVATLNAWQVDS